MPRGNLPTAAIDTCDNFREKEGEAIGREKGANDKAKDIAKGMLADGMPVANVAKYTQLSEDKVKGLRDRGLNAGRLPRKRETSEG